jgi:hypothetical protein
MLTLRGIAYATFRSRTLRKHTATLSILPTINTNIKRIIAFWFDNSPDRMVLMPK